MTKSLCARNWGPYCQICHEEPALEQWMTVSVYEVKRRDVSLTIKYQAEL